jgi:hypothetical protein
MSDAIAGPIVGYARSAGIGSPSLAGIGCCGVRRRFSGRIAQEKDGKEDMKMKITSSIEIRQKPEIVFPWVGDPHKAKQWQKNVGDAEILEGAPDKVGTTFREWVEEGGQGLDLLGTITGYVPGRSIAFHLESKVHSVDAEYSVEPCPNGARFSANTAVRWKFPMNLMSLFAGKKIQANLMEELRGECAELKRLCEAETD